MELIHTLTLAVIVKRRQCDYSPTDKKQRKPTAYLAHLVLPDTKAHVSQNKKS